MPVPIQVTFDCADPDRLARFWSEVLGYKLQEPPAGFSSWQEFLREQRVPEQRWNDASAIIDPDGRGPRIYFQRVPEPKSVKNRVHLDVNVGGGREVPDDERRRLVDEAAKRVVALGANQVRAAATDEFGDYWVVMQDPEGNEFCLQ